MRCSMLGVFLIALFPWEGANAQDSCVRPTEMVTTTVLIRESPDLAAPVLDRIPADGAAHLLGEVPGWFIVSAQEAKRGFASKQYLTPTLCWSAETGEDSFEIHAIDVGTGLSVLVTGADFALLYDGGSNDDIAKGSRNRVLAYLKAREPSLQRLDHVVLSHPHRDHVELLADVMAAYPVGDVWTSGARNEICGMRAFLRTASERRIRYHTALANFGASQEPFASGCQHDAEELSLESGARITTDPIKLGRDAAMQFLYVDGQTHSDLNDNSLVLLLTLGQHRVLLVGDAGGGHRDDPASPPDEDSIEGVLLACCRQQLPADVLVVGHHGSKTSSRKAFLDAVGAKQFVVSSGPFRYSGVQLPDAEVISELQARGTVWRTDADDDQCKTATSKIGEVDDGKAGGCNNVVLHLTPSGLTAESVGSQ